MTFFLIIIIVVIILHIAPVLLDTVLLLTPFVTAAYFAIKAYRKIKEKGINKNSFTKNKVNVINKDNDEL